MKKVLVVMMLQKFYLIIRERYGFQHGVGG